jgi:CDP-diacylglycerol--serine O-phosphatidyltransferase
MNYRMETAAIAIFVGMVADGLDGRVARLTNTQSAFGAQYDSLSDLIVFGLAPSLILFHWSLSHLGKLGWAVAFFYTAATALRLARFNTQVTDKAYFQGLPCPSAAGLMASFVWIGSAYGIDGVTVAPLAAMLTAFVALLMVSLIRYNSFKQIDNTKGRVPFVAAIIIVVAIVGIALEPPIVLFILFAGYIVAGPIATLVQIHRVKKQRLQEHQRFIKK